MTKPIRIVRARHDDKYFASSRATPQDRTLSWDARGVLWYLLSKSDNWELQPSDLQQGCGRDKVYKLLNELIEHRYIERIEERDKQQKFVGLVYRVYELPYPEKPYTAETTTDSTSQGEALPENPHKSQKPRPEKPDTANTHIRYNREEQSTEKDKSSASRAPAYGVTVDLTLVEGAGGSIRFDDGALLETSDRSAFSQAALAVYKTYWDMLEELGRAAAGGMERAWKKHELAALTLALARVAPDEVERYMVAQYRGDDPFWQNKPIAMSLKHIAENIRAWQARKPTTQSNGNGKHAAPTVPAEPVYQERPVEFDANMMLREMKARGEHNPGWLPPLRVPLNRKANADE